MANTAIAADETAIFKLASLNIILGLLPPNSKLTFFKFDYADIYNNKRPTGVLPVKAIFFIPIWRPNAYPVVGP